MGKVLNIGDRTVGQGSPVFVIAELGINHNGDLVTAEQMVREAVASGADAVKLQTYITEKRVPRDSPIFDLLKGCELTFDEQSELFRLGAELGVTVFSTPFDDESLEFLKGVGCPALKVASFDVVNEKLLDGIAATELPVILSRGMSTGKELDRAIGILGEHGSPYAILHCVSAYPVNDMGSLNLSTISYLASRYGCPVGFSDHTLGVEAPVVAVSAGADIIEKHFTLNTAQDGPDHAISADPSTLAEMVRGIRRMEEFLGSVVDGPVAAESDILQYRRPSSR